MNFDTDLSQISLKAQTFFAAVYRLGVTRNHLWNMKGEERNVHGSFHLLNTILTHFQEIQVTTLRVVWSPPAQRPSDRAG